MEKEQIMNALEARAKSEKAQQGSFEIAMREINNRANKGFNEAIIFDCYLSFEGIKKLMKLGFSVSEVIMHDQMKFQRVSW